MVAGPCRVAHLASGFNPVIVTGTGNIASSGQEGQSTQKGGRNKPIWELCREALRAEMAGDTVDRGSEGRETGSRYRRQGAR